MLKAIYAYVDAGGDGLDPPVREAIVHPKGPIPESRVTSKKRASKARSNPLKV